VAIDEVERIMRPKGVRYFDFLDSRFSYVRQFAPEFLNVMPPKANRGGAPVVRGIGVLRRMNEKRKRKVPSDAPEGHCQASPESDGSRSCSLARTGTWTGTAGSCACSRNCAGDSAPATCIWSIPAATPIRGLISFPKRSGRSSKGRCASSWG